MGLADRLSPEFAPRSLGPATVWGRSSNATANTASPWGQPSTLVLAWGFFVASSMMFIVGTLIGSQSPAFIGAILAVGGSVPTGLGWLFARALFRVEPRLDTWPLALVTVFFGLVLATEIAVVRDHADLAIVTVLRLLVTLVGFSVLVLTLLETIDDEDNRSSNARTGGRGEQRFRIYFLTGVCSLTCISFVLTRAGLPFFGLSVASIEAATASLAICGASLALRYRLSHPLIPAKDPAPSAGSIIASRRKEDAPASADPALTQRLRNLLQDGAIHKISGLDLRDLSERLDEPEQNVSVAITAGLGFGTLDQMLDHYRLDEAKRHLADPSRDAMPILMIALDSGYEAIGPFNRAFKTHLGTTPSAFRNAMKARRKTV